MWAQHHPFKNNDHYCCISGYLQYMHLKSVLSGKKTVLTHLKCKKPMRNLKKNWKRWWIMLAQNKEKQLTLTFNTHNFLYFWVFVVVAGTIGSITNLCSEKWTRTVVTEPTETIVGSLLCYGVGIIQRLLYYM